MRLPLALRATPQLACRFLGMLVVTLTAFSALPVAADTVPDFLQGSFSEPRIAGQGEYRRFGLKLYDARLWVGGKGLKTTIHPSAPFALELRYARSFKGQRIAEASIKEIRNLELGSEAQHKTWLAAMNDLFPDVEEGSTIFGVHVPGKGARFVFDGIDIGMIEDTEFSHAFFSIWLAEGTSAKELRTALLRQASPT
jgi:hypothetical protein